MFTEINELHRNKIIELLEEIIEFYKEDNWLTIKKYILRYSHPDIRKYFSTRHPKTKKHIINLFEKSFIDYCFKTYKIKFKLYKEDTHYEENIEN